MRRPMVVLMRVLPVTSVVLVGGCGITTLQWEDFLASTSIRVFVQAVSTWIEAAVVQAAGGA